MTRLEKATQYVFPLLILAAAIAGIIAHRNDEGHRLTYDYTYETTFDDVGEVTVGCTYSHRNDEVQGHSSDSPMWIEAETVYYRCELAKRND